jgi:hypothetical protein
LSLRQDALHLALSRKQEKRICLIPNYRVVKNTYKNRQINGTYYIIYFGGCIIKQLGAMKSDYQTGRVELHLFHIFQGGVKPLII